MEKTGEPQPQVPPEIDLSHPEARRRRRIHFPPPRLHPLPHVRERVVIILHLSSVCHPGPRLAPVRRLPR